MFPFTDTCSSQTGRRSTDNQVLSGPSWTDPTVTGSSAVNWAGRLVSLSISRPSGFIGWTAAMTTLKRPHTMASTGKCHGTGGEKCAGVSMLKRFFNRKTVVHGGAVIPHPFGISLFEHNVYFTDWTKMAVMKANKFTDRNPQVVYTTSQTPHGVAVMHQLKQPHGERPPSPSRKIVLFKDTGLTVGLSVCLQCRTPAVSIQGDVIRSAFWVTGVTMED